MKAMAYTSNLMSAPCITNFKLTLQNIQITSNSSLQPRFISLKAVFRMMNVAVTRGRNSNLAPNLVDI